MKKIALAAAILFAALWLWTGYNALAATWTAPPWEAPVTPLPQYQSQTSGSYDVQIHNRDDFEYWDEPMAAQHTSTCGAPPGTHLVHELGGSVFICNGHVMTAANANGYGMIAITPNQVVNCANGCSVQFDMSTDRMSARDWPDVWLTPWADNLTLPFNAGDVDLQGVPRRGIHMQAVRGQNSWDVSTISNYNEVMLSTAWWAGMEDDIGSGVNQAATRQTFKLTVLPGQVKFERLASATAPNLIWTLNGSGQPGFATCSCLLASDYVVQFGHHSYNPTKDNSGVPATWHWSGFALDPATPFTLIHMQPLCTGCPNPHVVMAENTLVSFDSPAPANAFLRFSGVCRVLIDGDQKERQAFIGHPEHASSYFVPIAEGKMSVSVSFAPDGFYHDGIGPGCAAQDFSIWAKAGGAPLTPTPTPIPPSPTNTSVPSPSATVSPLTVTPTVVATSTATSTLPTSTPTATPAMGTTVTFDTLAGQNRLLNGQYPTGLINWGSNKWWLAAPWPPHASKSISFNSGSGTSRTFDFVTPRVLLSLKAGGISPSTITLSCAGNPNKVQAIAANALTTIATGWTVPCVTVTVTSTNGWDTNFDDLLVQ